MNTIQRLLVPVNNNFVHKKAILKSVFGES